MNTGRDVASKSMKEEEEGIWGGGACKPIHERSTTTPYPPLQAKNGDTKKGESELVWRLVLRGLEFRLGFVQCFPLISVTGNRAMYYVGVNFELCDSEYF
jgi:hypothetical protein